VDDAMAAFARSGAINPRAIANKEQAPREDKLTELEREKSRLEALERSMAESATPRSGRWPGRRGLAHAARQLLEARGEPIAARGHRLRALELGGAPFAPALPPPGAPRERRDLRHRDPLQSRADVPGGAIVAEA
jgi:hypothetical protein